MSYRVVWKHSVTDQMADDYVTARGRGLEEAERFTKAVAEIDRLLASDPEEAGESRTGYERVLIVRPLVVTYEVYDEEQVVYILTLHYATPRGPEY
jgi:hypothetical protein